MKAKTSGVSWPFLECDGCGRRSWVRERGPCSRCGSRFRNQRLGKLWLALFMGPVFAWALWQRLRSRW